MLDRLNAQQTTESALAAVIYFLTDASEEFRKMVDVLILMVHPDLAGVVSMASMGAEMIGWLSRDG